MRRICTFLVGLYVGLSAVEVDVYNVNIKNQGTVAKVSPGETFGISAEYQFSMLKEKGKQIQLILGIDSIGGQVCFANGLVGWDHKCYDHYSLYYCQEKVDITNKTIYVALIAPEEKGKYNICFQKAFTKLPDQAINSWGEHHQIVIGKIIVE